MNDEAQIVEHVTTPRGDLVLRRRGSEYELISNGLFLMSTGRGESERLLARAALEWSDRPRSVLIAGLGVGYSVAAALEHPVVERVLVVEIEPAVVRWCRGELARCSSHALEDPRVDIVVDDLVRWVSAGDDRWGAGERFDAVCVDVDNGPEWTVFAPNQTLYDDAGLARLAGLVSPRGAIAFWSAAPSPVLRDRLRRRFRDVVELTVPVERGEPDCVLVGATPLGHDGAAVC